MTPMLSPPVKLRPIVNAYEVHKTTSRFTSIFRELKDTARISRVWVEAENSEFSEFYESNNVI